MIRLALLIIAASFAVALYNAGVGMADLTAAWDRTVASVADWIEQQ